VTTPKEELRRSLGLPSGPLAGVFSRLAPWKGQHVVLRALCELPGVQCLIAGDALFGEDAYAESLQKLTRSLGIADRVLFLGQRSDVPELMRAADIVIHPSVLPEPFGTTLLEAMMIGTPIVATDTGGSAEVLADGEAGILVPPGDSAALAAAIRAIIAKPEEFETRVQHAKVRVRQNFAPGKMKGAIAEIIETVAASGKL
jgi:glycosyltransferase involved in cell wall biosynthesis